MIAQIRVFLAQTFQKLQQINQTPGWWLGAIQALFQWLMPSLINNLEVSGFNHSNVTTTY